MILNNIGKRSAEGKENMQSQKSLYISPVVAA
jgi:hypothetical protein